MKIVINVLLMFLSSYSFVYATGEVESKNSMSRISYDHVLSWSIALFIVLFIFLAGIWFLRKTGALPMQSKENMKVVSAISLGMREKLVLVQVGKKQMVLGVSPGRVNNLLMLEGDEQLFQQNTGHQDEENFSQKLKQVMTGKVSE